MRYLLAGLLLLPVVTSSMAAEETEAIDREPEASEEAPAFDHEKHLGLKAGCDTCHVEKRSRELRQNPCAVCHEPEDGIRFLD